MSLNVLFVSSIVLVCLPTISVSEEAKGKQALLEAVSTHPSWKFLESEEDDVSCGESNNDRIIGGVDAALGQYPWLVRLGYNYNVKNRKETAYICGGSLINKKYVLTAAHCVTPLRPVTVRLGEHDVRTEVDCNSLSCADKVQDLDIAEIIAHNDYNNPKLANDIALLKLKGKAKYSDWVSPICLPKAGTTLDYSSKADVAGWGTTDMDTLDVANVLQTLTVPIVPLEKCAPIYRKITPITDKQICAGGVLDRDACGGDSGGPLMQVIMGEEQPQYYQMGLVSFGPKMCGGKPPGVFTDVPSYMQWILDNIKES